jgi:hypothetical protein
MASSGFLNWAKAKPAAIVRIVAVAVRIIFCSFIRGLYLLGGEKK